MSYHGQPVYFPNPSGLYVQPPSGGNPPPGIVPGMSYPTALPPTSGLFDQGYHPQSTVSPPSMDPTYSHLRMQGPPYSQMLTSQHENLSLYHRSSSGPSMDPFYSIQKSHPHPGHATDYGSSAFLPPASTEHNINEAFSLNVSPNMTPSPLYIQPEGSVGTSMLSPLPSVSRSLPVTFAEPIRKPPMLSGPHKPPSGSGSEPPPLSTAPSTSLRSSPIVASSPLSASTTETPVIIAGTSATKPIIDVTLLQQSESQAEEQKETDTGMRKSPEATGANKDDILQDDDNDSVLVTEGQVEDPELSIENGDSKNLGDGEAIPKETLISLGFDESCYSLSGDRYSCNMCVYSTHRLDKIMQHLKAHNGKIICEECGKAFIKQCDKDRHMVIHSESYTRKKKKDGQEFDSGEEDANKSSCDRKSPHIPNKTDNHGSPSDVSQTDNSSETKRDTPKITNSNPEDDNLQNYSENRNMLTTPSRQSPVPTEKHNSPASASKASPRSDGSSETPQSTVYDISGLSVEASSSVSVPAAAAATSAATLAMSIAAATTENSSTANVTKGSSASTPVMSTSSPITSASLNELKKSLHAEVGQLITNVLNTSNTLKRMTPEKPIQATKESTNIIGKITEVASNEDKEADKNATESSKDNPTADGSTNSSTLASDYSPIVIGEAFSITTSHESSLPEPSAYSTATVSTPALESCQVSPAVVESLEAVSEVDSEEDLGLEMSISSVASLRCQLCNYTASSVKNLEKHYKAHTNARKVCKYCGKAFERPSDLVRHLERHIKSRQQLGVSAPGPQVSPNEALLVRGKAKVNLVKYCKECNFSTRDLHEFSTHMRREHQGIRSYECNQCGVTYDKLSSLQEHKFTMHGAVNYVLDKTYENESDRTNKEFYKDLSNDNGNNGNRNTHDSTTRFESQAAKNNSALHLTEQANARQSNRDLRPEQEIPRNENTFTISSQSSTSKIVGDKGVLRLDAYVSNCLLSTNILNMEVGDDNTITIDAHVPDLGDVSTVPTVSNLTDVTSIVKKMHSSLSGSFSVNPTVESRQPQPVEAPAEYVGKRRKKREPSYFLNAINALYSEADRQGVAPPTHNPHYNHQYANYRRTIEKTIASYQRGRVSDLVGPTHPYLKRRGAVGRPPGSKRRWYERGLTANNSRNTMSHERGLNDGAFPTAVSEAMVTEQSLSLGNAQQINENTFVANTQTLGLITPKIEPGTSALPTTLPEAVTAPENEDMVLRIASVQGNVDEDMSNSSVIEVHESGQNKGLPIPDNDFLSPRINPEATYQCEKCNYCTNYENKFTQHMAAHNIGRLICKLCKKACIKVSDLTRHWITHAVYDEQNRLRCDSCDFVSHDKDILENHMKYHYHVRNPLPCTVDPTVFEEIAPKKIKEDGSAVIIPPPEPVIRKTIITSEEPTKKKKKYKERQNKHEKIECEICLKTIYKEQLSLHTKLHHPYYYNQAAEEKTETEPVKPVKEFYALVDGKPFSCSYCQKGFSSEEKLIRHENYHRTYKETAILNSTRCTVCNRKFCNKNYLADHMNTHTGEKPYECQKCGETFHMKQQLKMHHVKKRCPGVKKKKDKILVEASNEEVGTIEELIGLDKNVDDLSKCPNKEESSKLVKAEMLEKQDALQKTDDTSAKEKDNVELGVEEAVTLVDYDGSTDCEESENTNKNT